MSKLTSFLGAVMLSLALVGFLYAADSENQNANQSQSIEVSDGQNETSASDPDKVPPEVTCPDPSTIMACEEGEVEVPGFTVYDVENDIESIVSSIGTYVDGSVFFTPTAAGDYEIILTVTDSHGFVVSCTTTVTIEFNTAPTCTVPEGGLIMQCTPTEVCLPVSADDVDGNLVGCEVFSGPGEIIDGNWCYTPMGSETVDVTVKCIDECGAFCQSSFSIEFVVQENWAVLTVDRTGSMSLTNAFDESRILRAKNLAHDEIDKLLDENDTDYPGVFEVAIYYFNSTEGVILAQDFTSDALTLHDAIDAIPGPRHDTPLAAAMCQSHCDLPELDGECNRYVITYTDGLENASTEEDICELCVECNQYIPTGWNFDCDPNNPSSCTDWQLCLADKFSQSGVNLMHYFGNPINPFDKGMAADGLEDLYFLKYTAEQSDGQLIYHSDLEETCGDANGDGVLNVSDAIYIINYIFIPGSPAPEPLDAGDANWDGGINVSDAIFIMEYVFSGNEPPKCALE
ncbi:MAG: hypothetical protein GWO41_00485 [candidate division Zixibacteria bacterium]|nr:hypothetical protein [candidate division Zixibacteria bacterium]NIR63753.1 hypothetical protein [candidate division Zixibacteria bacterium]NIS15004.1 hypothetical protein [candidate division Zixibacteria bacterium]NIS45713.1 hypothetical protein [candidate division Zixibacteria bacterium]NIT51261.1 hypothetical protein [candidate division Zixibacteria bacterium]